MYRTSHLTRRLGLRLLAACGLAAALVAPAAAQGSAPYRIGALLDVTGGASFLGKPEQNAVVLAIEQVNAAGGIRGRKVELVFEDAKSTETDSVLGARKLITQANVAALIGTSRTGGAMAILPIASEAGVPMLAPVSGVAVVEPVAQRKWIFRPGQGGDLSVGKVIDYARRAGWKKLGVLYSADAYGEDGRDNMRKLAPAAGGDDRARRVVPVGCHRPQVAADEVVGGRGRRHLHARSGRAVGDRLPQCPRTGHQAAHHFGTRPGQQCFPDRRR